MAQTGGENKAFFQIQDPECGQNGNHFFVQFNPKEFKYDETAGWSDGKSASDGFDGQGSRCAADL